MCSCENNENDGDIVNESLIGLEDEGAEDSEPHGQESEPRLRPLKISGRHAFLSLWTLICPPWLLFLDWQEILRNRIDRLYVYGHEAYQRPLPKKLGPI